MYLKSLILLVLLALLSLGGVGGLATQAATQVPSPLLAGPTAASTRATCATVPVLEVDESVQTDIPTITAVAALQIAEAHVQAGCARQIKLDEDDCRLIYKIKIGAVKVKVDARSGAVLDVEYSDD
jgi:hypothetical protein